VLDRDPQVEVVEIRAATDRAVRHIDPAGRALHVSLSCGAATAAETNASKVVP
jgi:hypothetical protein